MGAGFLRDRLYLGVGAGPHIDRVNRGETSPTVSTYDRDSDLLLMGLGYVW